jgi:hypothetical protein
VRPLTLDLDRDASGNWRPDAKMHTAIRLQLGADWQSPYWDRTARTLLRRSRVHDRSTVDAIGQRRCALV